MKHRRSACLNGPQVARDCQPSLYPPFDELSSRSSGTPMFYCQRSILPGFHQLPSIFRFETVIRLTKPASTPVISPLLVGHFYPSRSTPTPHIYWFSLVLSYGGNIPPSSEFVPYRDDFPTTCGKCVDFVAIIAHHRIRRPTCLYG